MLCIWQYGTIILLLYCTHTQCLLSHTQSNDILISNGMTRCYVCMYTHTYTYSDRSYYTAFNQRESEIELVELGLGSVRSFHTEIVFGFTVRVCMSLWLNCMCSNVCTEARDSCSLFRRATYNQTSARANVIL